MPNRTYVARDRICGQNTGMSTRGLLEDLVDFAESESNRSKPKFKVIREPSVRFPNFSVEIFVDGNNTDYSRNDIDSVLDNPDRDKFLSVAVPLSDTRSNSQTLMIINNSETTYKTLLTLYHSDDTKYSTRVNVYDDVELAEIEGEYSLMYKIEVGRSGVNVGSQLRSVLGGRDDCYLYELLDNTGDKSVVLDKTLV